MIRIHLFLLSIAFILLASCGAEPDPNAGLYSIKKERKESPVKKEAATARKAAGPLKLEADSPLQLLKSKELRGDSKAFDGASDGYIVVYAPVLNDNYRFDHQLHNAGMYTYFEQEPSKRVETILIGGDSAEVFDQFMSDSKNAHPEIVDALSFIRDKDEELLKALDIDADHLAHGGVALTFDAKGKQIIEEEDYKCQGEKLLRMHQHFFPRSISFPANKYEIKVGEKIPPALNTYFAPYLGKQNVLMTFYPAPLSHSCSIQMATLGEFAVAHMETKDLKTIAVSIGSDEQISAWAIHQNIKGIEMKADPDGSMSNAFNSLLKDDYGIIYSDRTVFLINKSGIVEYINEDYDVAADLDKLEAAIKDLEL